jgi:hypothetical protein
MFVCPFCHRANGSPSYTTESRRAYRRHLLHAGRDVERRRIDGQWVDTLVILSAEQIELRKQQKRRSQRHSRAMHQDEQARRQRLSSVEQPAPVIAACSSMSVAVRQASAVAPDASVHDLSSPGLATENLLDLSFGQEFELSPALDGQPWVLDLLREDAALATPVRHRSPEPLLHAYLSMEPSVHYGPSELPIINTPLSEQPSEPTYTLEPLTIFDDVQVNEHHLPPDAAIPRPPTPTSSNGPCTPAPIVPHQPLERPGYVRPSHVRPRHVRPWHVRPLHLNNEKNEVVDIKAEGITMHVT